MANNASDALCFAVTDPIARILSVATRDQQDAILLYLWQFKLCQLLGIPYDPMSPRLQANTGDWNGRAEQARINEIAAMAAAIVGATTDPTVLLSTISTILKNYSKDQRDSMLALAKCGCWANGLS